MPAIEETSRPAPNQDAVKLSPGFSTPLRFSTPTSRLQHSSTVVFVLNLYHLPLPAPPKTFPLAFCRNHKASSNALVTCNAGFPHSRAFARQPVLRLCFQWCFVRPYLHTASADLFCCSYYLVIL